MNKFGTAAWFAIIGGGVLAAGWALWTGRRWGRGVAVFAQLLLLPVAWYIAVGSHQWIYGIPRRRRRARHAGAAVQPVGGAVAGGLRTPARPAPTTPGPTPDR